MNRVKTPRPTSDETGKPTNPPRTPKPTKLITSRPTKVITPRPTKADNTPRPTAWTAPKSPRPTREITPRPTNVVTPRPTATYLVTTPEPTEDQSSGWGTGQPMSGCAKYTTQSACSDACIWKSGYPPYSFAEVAQEEFVQNGGFDVNSLMNNEDFLIFYGIGLLIAAVLVFSFTYYSKRRRKAVDNSEYSPLVK